jgi:hypothetical protein
MEGVLRRRFATALWIPLLLREIHEQGKYGHLGYEHDYYGVRTLAVHADRRERGDKISFSDLAQASAPHTWDGNYIPAGSYRDAATEEIGVSLVMEQSFDGPSPTVVHISQDMVLALGLIEEAGGVWVRPAEGYVEVIRVSRNEQGQVLKVVISPEHLRDYLAARKMALVTSTYRERRATFETPQAFGLSEDEETHRDDREGGAFELRVAPVHEGGFEFGASTAVFKISRTDTWDADELPILNDPDDGNTVSERSVFQRRGRKLFTAFSEFRRTEWIEPAAASLRVARDDVPSSVSFITDAQGGRTPAAELDYEEVGRWLWFSPRVITDLIARRGFRLAWYTRFTGGLKTPSGWNIHFGINDAELVVVYAWDIARLDEWEQRIWAGHNVVPSGGLGEELESSHVRAEVADTQAPEDWLIRALEAVASAAYERWGINIFGSHQSIPEIAAGAHRFIGMDERGFLALAKELARLTSDNLNAPALHRISPPSGNEGRGTLKSLERALATIVTAERAKALLTPLVGIYELRHADAHLPSSKLLEALEMAGVSAEEPLLSRGAHLIHNVVAALFRIAAVMKPNAVSHDEGDPA